MRDTQKALIFIAALLGFLSVAAGSFGAHALKSRLDRDSLSIFEVGVRYQMYHALAIFASAWLGGGTPHFLAPLSGWLFFSGTCLFSGSLYLLALSNIRIFGMITPIGGVVLLSGWLILALAALSYKTIN